MAPNHSQLNLPPVPVNRVERRARVRINEVDTAAEDARRAIARAVGRALTRTGTPYKALGDKAQISRWVREHNPENPVLHRLWICPQLRKALVITLAEEAGMAVEITVRDRIA